MPLSNSASPAGTISRFTRLISDGKPAFGAASVTVTSPGAVALTPVISVSSALASEMVFSPRCRLIE